MFPHETYFAPIFATRLGTVLILTYCQITVNVHDTMIMYLIFRLKLWLFSPSNWAFKVGSVDLKAIKASTYAITS